jgi:hypothetical protein
MDLSKIPPHIMQVMQDRQLTMPQKMMAFTMLMPHMPNDPKVAQYCDDNLEVGKKIKGLIEEGKIRLGKMDKNFILEVETVA